jgi:DNA-binding response OmpR family regulator
MAKKRLLIVDDEVDLAEMIKFRMESNGYEVLLAHDGQAALETARKERPDLIILDLMLPKMDGYKVCGLLKKDGRYASIPIIIFTAKGQDDDMKLGEELGADAYIVKPFEPQVLLGKIKELTEK